MRYADRLPTVRDVDSPEFDLVLYGVSGFAGRLLAAHVARHAPPGLRVAVAGRSASRIEAIRDSLPPPVRHWPTIVADATDVAAVDNLAKRARVVATTVGPYARYGGALVDACARNGTHYADLTGEVLFMRHSIEANEAAARASGARIVHACGFDSVPSDLGVWSLHDHAQTAGAGTLERVTGLFTGGSGGFSGGTVDSMRVQFEDLERDPAGRTVVADPHALDPGADNGQRVVATPGPPDRWDAHFDADLGYWLAPFVMAGVNTRVVRRSHALLAEGGGTGGAGYGPGFRYREAVGIPGRIAGALPAGAVAAATVGFGAAMSVSALRPVLDRVLPTPGTGPSQRAMDRGWFRMRLIGETSSGRVLQADVGAHLDPGYGATAVMLGESALALAADEGPVRGGVSTPAVALGGALLRRLRQRGFDWPVTEFTAAVM